MSSKAKRILTLDSNVFVGAAKSDEPARKKCLDILEQVAETFILSELSIVCQEVLWNDSKEGRRRPSEGV